MDFYDDHGDEVPTGAMQYITDNAVIKYCDKVG